jgi:hypothetical protein
VTKKKHRWYYAEKLGNIYAFQIPRERDYWVFNSSGCTAMNNHSVMQRFTLSRRQEIQRQWPNRDHDSDTLIEYYLKEMDTLQAELERTRRKMRLIRKVIEYKTGCKYKNRR